MAQYLTFEAEPFTGYMEFDEAESSVDSLLNEGLSFEWEGEAARRGGRPPARTVASAPASRGPVQFARPSKRPPAQSARNLSSPATRRTLTPPTKRTTPRPAIKSSTPRPAQGLASPPSKVSASPRVQVSAAPRVPVSAAPRLQGSAATADVKVDPTDVRIDVGAKFALQRMLKRPDAQQDAARLILAINSKRLAGIFGDDLRAAVDVARKHGTQRWLLVPKGEDAVLVVDQTQPLTAPPTIIFRGDTPDIRSNHPRIDLALQKASRTFQAWDSKQLTRCQGGTTSAEVWEGEDPSPTTPVPGIVPPILCLRSTVIVPVSVNVPPITAADVPGLFARALKPRAFLNEDNPKRTNFYVAYWEKNKEIPWALLAHLVSRNAGYQMTDLVRYIKYSRNPLTALVVSRVLTPLGAAGVLVNAPILLLMFRFLEAGNFLIFHDVFPQLAAYSLAKDTFKLTRDSSLSLLFFDQLAAEGVDALIVNEWRQFFGEAVKVNFWEGVAAPESDPNIVRLSHALVVNEQNYIEDRLLVPVPGVPVYSDLPQNVRDLYFTVSDALGLTKLVFPASVAAAPFTPTTLHLNTVGNFSSLIARINTGRKLFFGCFLSGSTRNQTIKRWASSGPFHNGSRTNYDAAHFTVDTDAVTVRLLGRISSVPLSSGHLSKWPGPPPSSIRNWSTLPARASLFASSLPILPVDPFAAPEGEVLTAGASRPLKEVLG